MPTYSYTPAPPPLTQEELDALAAEQQAMGGYVPAGGYQAVPPPPATSYATEPVGGNDTITTGYSAGYGAPSVGQGQGYGVSSPAPQAAPYIPEPAPAPAPSTRYGGPALDAPAISTGLVEMMHPASGVPATSRVVPSTPRATQDARRESRFAGSAERWAAHPVERRPIPPSAAGFNTGSVPGGPGNFWRRTPAELSAFRSRYRLEHPPASTPPSVDPRGTPRRPAAAIVAPVPLPVAQDPSPVDFFRAWWEAHGLWPHYRTRLQDDLGAPLFRGLPRQSG